MENLIDPWASFSLDYDKLVNQFGIGKVSDIIDDIENSPTKTHNPDISGGFKISEDVFEEDE